MVTASQSRRVLIVPAGGERVDTDEDRPDVTERRLVDALIAAPRATIRALAAAAGLSDSAARTRLNDLLDSGLVEISTLVHPAVRGKPILFFVVITGRDGHVPDLDDVPVLDEAPWIVRYRDTGQLLAQVSGRSTDEVHVFLERVNALAWVEHATAMIVLKIHAGRSAARRVGHAPGPWNAPETTSLDRADQTIITRLRADGRASYTALSHATGLSLPTTRRRVLALVADHVIRFTTVVNTPGTVHAVLYTDVEISHRAAYLAAATATEGIVYVSELLGEHDFCCDILAPDADTLGTIVGVMIALPGVAGHALHPVTRMRRKFTRTTGLDRATEDTA